jgi:hypothetical protein
VHFELGSVFGSKFTALVHSWPVEMGSGVLSGAMAARDGIGFAFGPFVIEMGGEVVFRRPIFW